MGKSDTLRFEFANGRKVFYSGERINGRLVVNLKKETKVREIRLKFKGSAHCHWVEESSNKTTFYKAKADYLNEKVTLFGKGLGMGEDNTLPKREHLFQFSFQLPNGLPTSLEHKTGYIRYSIKGKIDKPWSFNEKTSEKICVVSVLDLNVIPNVRTPVYSRQEKFLCCFCCSSGPITAMFRINRTGFVSGQAIPFEAEIQNLSNRACKVAVKLMMSITFYVENKTKSHIEEKASVTHPDILPGETEIWSNGELLPPLLIPSFIPSSIVDVVYQLQLVIDPAGPAKKLTVPLGIIIGTVPLHSDTRRQQLSNDRSTCVEPSFTQSIPAAPALPLPLDHNSIITALSEK